MMKILKKSLIKAEHSHKNLTDYKLKNEVTYSSVASTFKNQKRRQEDLSDLIIADYL